MRPLIEYFPVDYVSSKRDAVWEFINETDPRQKSLKGLLDTHHGIYIFYDSLLRAIYVGKAKRTSLYREMRAAYNRPRGKNQMVWGVAHLSQQRVFDPEREAVRKIQRIEMQLHDLAYYFSAYSIDDELIDTIEALLIRAFANQLANRRKETFKLE